MRVYEVMTRNALCTKPETTLSDAARRMRDLDIGSLPVCDNDRLVGVVTDRDIAIRSVAEGHNPNSEHVCDIMSRGVTWCFEDQNVQEAAEIMREKQIRRLPVLSRDKRLVGIVSLGDLAVQAGNDKLTGETLEGISELPEPRG